MAKIIIGFSTLKKATIFSNSIKLIENTKFSHVYIKYHLDNINRDIIFQASGLTVNFENVNLFYNKETVLKEFELDISEEMFIEVQQFAADNVGLPYSPGDIAGLLVEILARKIGIKINNPYKNDKRAYVCSKLVAYILKEDLGIDIEDPNSMLPVDVYTLLENIEKGRT